MAFDKKSTEKEQLRTVVLAIDESECSDFAWEYYLQNVYKKRDRIIFVHAPEYTEAINSPLTSGGVDPAIVVELIKKEKEMVQKLMEKYTNKLKMAKLQGRLLQVNGKPGEAIIKVVKTEGATILILGSRGIGKVQRAILGSVSDYCVHHSPVPVLVCRNKDKK
ncbi:uncharacterized protein LOC115222663 [Argonauta hians]